MEKPETMSRQDHVIYNNCFYSALEKGIHYMAVLDLDEVRIFLQKKHIFVRENVQNAKKIIALKSYLAFPGALKNIITKGQNPTHTYPSGLTLLSHLTRVTRKSFDIEEFRKQTDYISIVFIHTESARAGALPVSLHLP